MTLTRPVVTSIVLAFAVGTPACDSSTVAEEELEREFEESFGEEIPSDVEAPGDDLPNDGVVPLMGEFARIIPDPNKVLSVNITEQNITVVVQQVEDATLVDEYTFGLSLGFRGPNPAAAPPGEPLETLVFNLDDVDWSQVPAMCDTAIDEAVADSGISNVTAAKGTTADGAVSLRVFTTGGRGSGYSDFTAAGALIATSAG